MIPGLVLLTTAVGYAVVMQGGDDPVPSAITLLLIAAAAACEFMRRAGEPSVASRDRAITLAALAFPAYVAFQLIPLPLSLLSVLSPARAGLAHAFDALGAESLFAPITISAPTTWMHLFRVSGYVLTFLTVRRICGRIQGAPWQPAMPLMVIGVAEAAWGLAGNSVEGQLSGTYYSKNHFAGLLEMVLPFLWAYALVILGRRSRLEGITVPAALLASALLAGALLIFVAITSSLSKGGVLATFTSLLAGGMFVAARHLSGRTRIGAFSVLIVGAALLFVFVTPTDMVERFAVVVADDQTEGRLPIWLNTLRLIAAYPLVGIGMGNFYPGLLPYQTYANERSWVAAHNDYLQPLAELGMIGFIIPATLMALSLVRAATSALSSFTRDAQLLGLACTGALIAMAMHSLADFNTYILANGLVLAWVAAIASTMVLSEVRPARCPRGTLRDGLRGPVLLLAGVTIMWTGGSLLYLQRYRIDAAAERKFCRFGICDTLSAMEAQSQGAPDAPPRPLRSDVLLEYLQRDPAEPSRWQDLGVSYQAAGRLDLARVCFDRALALAPNSPSTLLSSADFHFDIREEDAALGLIFRVLADSELTDQAVFAVLAYRKVDVNRVFEHALPDGRSAQAYLRSLLSDDRPDEAQRAWRSIVSRGYADDEAARDYFRFLVGKARFDTAARDWQQYVSGRDAHYPEQNLVFNGGFELDPVASPFDWRMGVVPGVLADLAPGVGAPGRSLRLQFDGTTNAGDLGVSQMVYLPAGTYQLRAAMKADGVTTDQGIRIAVSGTGLEVVTEDVRGSDDWRDVSVAFEIGASGLVRVRVERGVSLKFDNLVSGTAWVDGVTIKVAVR